MPSVHLIRYNDHKRITVNPTHVLRLDQGQHEDSTTVVMTDGRIEVEGDIDEVSRKFNSPADHRGKAVLLEDASESVSDDSPKTNREYKKPVDPQNMFADENYDQPVVTKPAKKPRKK